MADSNSRKFGSPNRTVLCCECWKTFVPYTPAAGTQKYCSHRCRWRSGYQRANERRNRIRRSKRKWRFCRECGQPFVPKRRNVLYCDKTCSRRNCQRRWRRENLEKCRESVRKSCRRRRASDPERYRKANREYMRRQYEDNPEKIIQRRRAWKIANPEKTKASNEQSRCRRREIEAHAVVLTVRNHINEKAK
jgi:hypothetical protein